MTRRQRCSMPRRPGGLRWRRPLAVLLGLTVLLALDGSGILRVGLGCAMLHECGHALAYRLLWQRWPEIEVSPFGLCLRLRGLPMTNLQELLLAAAGPAVNLLACAAVLAFMRATAYTYGGYWFACCNLLVGGSSQGVAKARAQELAREQHPECDDFRVYHVEEFGKCKKTL